MRSRLPLPAAAPRRMAATASLTGAAAVLALVLSSSAVAAPGDLGRLSGAAPVRGQALPAAAPAGSDGLVDRLTRQLGGRSAGAYLDPATGRLVVTVARAADAATVRAAGAQPRLVRHSGQQLAEVTALLDRAGGVPGTSWGIDPVRNAVVVSVPAGQRDARTTAFVQGLARYGRLVTVERVPAAPVTTAFYGGQGINGGTVRCSAAFNAVRGGSYYVLTAGHCAQASFLWTNGLQLVGTTARSEFPTSDYGLIAVTAPFTLDQEPYILSGAGRQRITHHSRVPVGTRVCKTGATTATTCGAVRRYDVTVNYTDGAVYGLTETTVCTAGGDSGGGLFAGRSAQGIVSGAIPVPCAQPGFRSYFQPVDEVLRASGLRLL